MALELNVMGGPTIQEICKAIINKETTVSFVTSEKPISLSIPVFIEKIQRKDREDTQWLISGFQRLTTGQIKEISLFYDSHTRKGTIKID